MSITDRLSALSGLLRESELDEAFLKRVGRVELNGILTMVKGVEHTSREIAILAKALDNQLKRGLVPGYDPRVFDAIRISGLKASNQLSQVHQSLIDAKRLGERK